MEEKNFVSTAVHLLIVKQNFVPNVERALIASRMLPFRRRFISRLTL